MVRQRVRIRFCKHDDLRLIGHRDLVRTMERLFRRAKMQLGMSQGFHPKPRMSFPSALAVGIEGLNEVMELELAASYDEDELLTRLTNHSLPGLTFRSVETLSSGVKKAQVRSLSYRIPVPANRCSSATQRLATLLACQSFPVYRANRRKPIDLRSSLETLILGDELLTMTLRVSQQANPGPRDVLTALGLDDLERNGQFLTRNEVELCP